MLARELSSVRIPVVAVLGNHDVESCKQADVALVLKEAGVSVLDGDACEVLGVGIAGAKGFGGGFGKRALAPWGETVLKEFAREAVEEALKLEKALTRLRTTHVIALMHYAPVKETVDGEPSRSIRFSARAGSRIHQPLPGLAGRAGHAHQGRAEGKTSRGARLQRVDAAAELPFPDRLRSACSTSGTA